MSNTAMRDALLKIKSLFRDIDLSRDTPENEAYAIAESAIAIPLRNCDVGTAEEQKRRFKEYCDKHYDLIEHHGCKGCPARNYIEGWGVPYCQLKWAQMPYEAKEGGAE